MSAKLPDALDTMCAPVGNAAGEPRREAGITGWASRVLSGTGTRNVTAQRRSTEGVYILPAAEVQAGRHLREDIFIAPDGYIRRSPVQEIMVDPLYHKRIVWRIVRGVFVVAALIAALYVLTIFKWISV